jgi:hypothetical protein
LKDYNSLSITFSIATKIYKVSLAILNIRCLGLTSKFTTFNFITGEDIYFEKSAPLYH